MGGASDTGDGGGRECQKTAGPADGLELGAARLKRWVAAAMPRHEPVPIFIASADQGSLRAADCPRYSDLGLAARWRMHAVRQTLCQSKLKMSPLHAGSDPSGFVIKLRWNLDDCL